MLLGKTYAKPLSSLNPLPYPVSEGADFYLFQVRGLVVGGDALGLCALQGLQITPPPGAAVRCGECNSKQPCGLGPDFLQSVPPHLFFTPNPPTKPRFSPPPQMIMCTGV